MEEEFVANLVKLSLILLEKSFQNLILKVMKY